MPCVKIPNGFACSRRRQYAEQPKHYCVVCLRDGVKTHAPTLCDFRSEVGGPTCDKGLCNNHAMKHGFDDYCPDHDPKESK